MADGVDLTLETPGLFNVAIASMGSFAPCLLDEIELAFGAWSAVADILFVPVTDGGGPFSVDPMADIRIGAHVFDGPSGALAHAFFPPPNLVTAAGDTHFDSAEAWTCAPGAGSIGFGIVALHELGHAIGLDHELTDIAVMNPFYNAALTFGPLADDLIGAGEIYGEAGAAVTSFFGPVGIGTASPLTDLHVFGSATEDIFGGFGVDPSFPGDCAFNFGYGGATFGPGVGFMNVRDCAQNSGNVRLQFNVKGAEKLRLTTAGATFTGNVGIGTSNPTNILEVAAASGTGFVDSSGNFVDGSSREFKDEIRDLDLQSAQEVLRELEPVRYFGKNSHEDEHLGFIAEDVPDLVAQTGRKGLRAMDIVAVLTKVVQEQQENIEVLKARIDITGNLTMSGNCTDAPRGGGCTPDYIFEPGYELESIEEHAAVMWENRHLPAVGKGDDTLNVVKTTWGMLEEIEKAHIYIERLHEQLKGLKEKDRGIRELEQRLNDRDAVFSRRLSRLEALLGAVPAD